MEQNKWQQKVQEEERERERRENNVKTTFPWDSYFKQCRWMSPMNIWQRGSLSGDSSLMIMNMVVGTGIIFLSETLV